MIDIVNTYVGLPWLDGGRNIDGFDCWGFFIYFYKNQLGIDLKLDFDAKPGETSNIVKCFAEHTTNGDWLKIEKPVDNCGVALSQNKRIHHVGVWVGEGCLHAVKGLGVVYNTLAQLKRNGYNKVEFYTCKNQNY